MKNCSRDAKQLKDPIYGYISIKTDIIKNIVDTAEFQRLRGVVQTSYAPLYSSAVHNRFVHSLGVYYLGSLVSDNIRTTCSDLVKKFKLDKYFDLFEVACLLHDVGHAPFSHTGEEFYLDNGKRDNLHAEIISLTGDKNLEKEILDRNYKAAAHELMSVIVSLKRFSELFDNSEDKSFFARCILGYEYSVKNDPKHSILNCIISLLNSSVIDVDKLDYLIRDAFTTGFDTVAIDYKRLLNNIIFFEGTDGRYKRVYKKGALSVIENVVYAHDAERKWIQMHPIVQYDAYLIESIIKEVNDKYNNVKLFSYDALTLDGVSISKNYSVSLLSDADIIFLMKNLKSGAVSEYFSRSERRHPLWKSESEYKAIFSTGFVTEDFETLEKGFADICKFCQSHVINDVALKKCKRDLKKSQNMIDQHPENAKGLQAVVDSKKIYIHWIEAMRKFAKSQDIPFDFVIINTKQFTSGFAKEEFSKLEILFDTSDEPQLFSKVTNVLDAHKSERDQFLYIYCRKGNRELPIDVNELASNLFSVVSEKRNHDNFGAARKK